MRDKDFIITHEQVRTKPSWFDKELESRSWAPPNISILSIHISLPIHPFPL